MCTHDQGDNAINQMREYVRKQILNNEVTRGEGVVQAIVEDEQNRMKN